MEKVSKTLSLHMERIAQLLSRMDAHEKSLPKIERDMLLAALRDMYEAVYMLDVDADAGTYAGTDAGAALSVGEKAQADSPVAAGNESADAAPEAVQQPVKEDNGLSVLMADVEAEPIYAADPDLLAQEEQASQQPTVEEIEGQRNDELFEEPDQQPLLEKEQPKTLWEKLNDSQKVGTIAEAVTVTRTISDMYEDASGKTVAKEPKAEAKEPKVEAKEPKAGTKEQEVDAESGKQDDAGQKQEKTDPKNKDTEPKTETPSKQPSLFDYFKSSSEKPAQRTIAESLGAGKVNDVDRKLNANKVKDLRTVININDKFSFMNELFHNNMKGYNDFIMRLNALGNRKEALAYVNEIAQQYKWDDESLTVKTFYTIFDRKF